MATLEGMAGLVYVPRINRTYPKRPQMRAETQKNVEKIEKSLDLLGQRLDWETAPHRLAAM